MWKVNLLLYIVTATVVVLFQSVHELGILGLPKAVQYLRAHGPDIMGFSVMFLLQVFGNTELKPCLLGKMERRKLKTLIWCTTSRRSWEREYLKETV